ncbi:hypothetical protein MBLNU230_g7841t1 [Neophaeotheca triangularis]
MAIISTATERLLSPISNAYTTSTINFNSPTPLPSKSLADPPSQLAGIVPALHPPSTSPTIMALDPPPRCLFFDVFGTCVDWRTTVTNALYNATRAALNSPTSSIATRIRILASDMTYADWEALAQEWRNSYLAFTKRLASDPTIPFKTVDAHHLDSLRELLTTHGLLLPRSPPSPDKPTPDDLLTHDGSLWDEPTIRKLSLIWHLLDPWDDTAQGLGELNQLFWTSTLSNGNLALLADLQAHANLPFTHLFSAEMFNAYKPNPAVYLGAAAKMGLRPDECVMVAAHAADLRAAKECGLRTVYVQRPGEEREGLAREECGFVDVWVGEGEGGFVGLAERLGVMAERGRKRSLSAPPEVGGVV